MGTTPVGEGGGVLQDVVPGGLPQGPRLPRTKPGAPQAPHEGLCVVGMVPHGVHRQAGAEPLLGGRLFPGAEPAVQVPAQHHLHLANSV